MIGSSELCWLLSMALIISNSIDRFVAFLLAKVLFGCAIYLLVKIGSGTLIKKTQYSGTEILHFINIGTSTLLI